MPCESDEKNLLVTVYIQTKTLGNICVRRLIVVKGAVWIQCDQYALVCSLHIKKI